MMNDEKLEIRGKSITQKAHDCVVIFIEKMIRFKTGEGLGKFRSTFEVYLALYAYSLAHGRETLYGEESRVICAGVLL